MISDERLAAGANAIGDIILGFTESDLKGYAFFEQLARAALEAADAAITSEETQTLVAQVINQRMERFEAAYKIACPHCGKPVGRECINMGSGGGPLMCQERLDAVVM